MTAIDHRRADGSYCCMCDFCNVSPCSAYPLDTLGFSGYHYIVYCKAHEGVAEQEARRFLDEHPDIIVELEDDVDGDHLAKRLQAR